jgi:hypothetical protein
MPRRAPARRPSILDDVPSRQALDISDDQAICMLPPLLLAQEASSYCERQLCCGGRSFEMELLAGGAGGALLYTVARPLEMTVACGACCGSGLLFAPQRAMLRTGDGMPVGEVWPSRPASPPARVRPPHAAKPPAPIRVVCPRAARA